MKKVAIIDLGTNSVRVCVCQIENNKHRIVFMDRSSVMLGKDMTEDNILNPDAIKRTIDAICEYKKIFSELGVEYTYAVATAAVRKAKNKEFFLQYFKEKTGITLNIISGEDEAKYDYLAINDTINLSDYLIMDIGGGSSEIIGVKSGELTDFISIPLASRNITEKYLTPENEKNILNAENIVFEEFSKVSWLKNYSNLPIVGIGGCFKAIGKSVSEKSNLEFTPIFKTEYSEISNLYGEVKTLSVEERIKLIGKSKGDIILGGMMPFMSVSKIVSPSKIYFTAKGVTDGIIYELSKRDA